MNDFKEIPEVCGVRIFYKQAESSVRNSALRLVVLTGSTDDTLVPGGKPGLYHWFEHVPFRGTTRYPGGKKNIKSIIAETGGGVNAETGSYTTTFHANVPTKYLELAIDGVVDLVSCPTLRKKDILAEKSIIKQEIGESLADTERRMVRQIVSDVWKGHPLEFEPLGKAEDLDDMDPSVLRKAHTCGYSTSRMFFVIETSADKDTVCEILSRHFERLPFRPSVSKRIKAEPIKPIQWRPGIHRVITTKFESSSCVLLLPTLEKVDNVQRYTQDWLIKNMLAHGSTQSPLMKEIRYRRSLAYSGEMGISLWPDGGFMVFKFDTSKPNKVLSLIKTKVLHDRRLYSRNWLKTVVRSMQDNRDMKNPNPKADARGAAGCIARFGEYFTDEVTYDLLSEISFESVQAYLEDLRSNLDNARTFVFKGGK